MRKEKKGEHEKKEEMKQRTYQNGAYRNTKKEFREEEMKKRYKGAKLLNLKKYNNYRHWT
jgi:hypothetical protein